MEHRLIDANYIVDVANRAYDAWNLAMATQDTNREVNKVLRRQEFCMRVKAVADDAPTIDLETLPIVRELRDKLEQVTAERDELASLSGKLVILCNPPILSCEGAGYCLLLESVL